jgi:site-specific DNA recombinase
MDEKEPKYDKVVAYLRKSSEDNVKGEQNKQLNSIEYQRQFAKDAVVRYNLKPILKTFEDDKTGYEAYVRDGFEAMLTFLEDNKNEVDGIVCTEISRLARNFGDGGKILWFLQNGTIKRIYTPSKEFTNSSSDQLMVAIEFAMSKKSSDEGSYRTKAGMKSKAHNIKHPARGAIPGYVTDGPVGQKKWLIDPVIGPKVRQVFESFATGQFTLQEIADYAYDIGLRSTSRKSTTGKISKNTWHNRLKDTQYIGIFHYDGEEIAGEYDQLIQPELFYEVQAVLTGHGHPKETHLDYAYSGIIKCGLCGGMLSGTHKKGITYYRCGKKRSPCKETDRITYITEQTLENNLLDALEHIEIDQNTWEACREYVSELNQPERINIKKQIRELNEKISAEIRHQDEIGNKLVDNLLDKTAYDRLMTNSKAKIASLRNTVVKCENISNELDELMYNFLDNVKYVTKRLRIAMPMNKRELINIFCENLEWKDGKARWDWKKPYFILAKQPNSANVLAKWDDYRKADWSELIDCPEIFLEQTNQLLAI